MKVKWEEHLLTIGTIIFCVLLMIGLQAAIESKVKMAYEQGKADGKIEAALERVEQTLKEKVK